MFKQEEMPFKMDSEKSAVEKGNLRERWDHVTAAGALRSSQGLYQTPKVKHGEDLDEVHWTADFQHQGGRDQSHPLKSEGEQSTF